MKQDVNGYLIKPFQRVCKYVLLLKELLKNTPSEWSDAVECETAMHTIDAIVRKANEIQRIFDNLTKLHEVQSMIDIVGDC
jgi:predicted nucleotide-binding protein (sugar kinase/HSP70/actin superfamily)